MRKHNKTTQFIFLFVTNLGTILNISLACPNCPPQNIPPSKPPPYPLRVPPLLPPKLPLPIETPPSHEFEPPPAEAPCPPLPPPSPRSEEKPYPPPIPLKPKETCPIDTIKFGTCVDTLDGHVAFGIGGSAEDICCPIVEGLVETDAALCLCMAIKAKFLDVDVLIPIALEVLVGCGNNPLPPGFQCPP